jgi:acetyltransferase-like isoleucine patch superfamily enzyme
MRPLIKRIVNSFYNLKHHTKIVSTKASLKAKYGAGVVISENVVVTDDVTIGKFSYVNRNSSIENCTIGNYCSISSGVWICPHEHELKFRSTHPFASRGIARKSAPVVIRNDVLVSLNVIILSGVTIGNGSVIGAGAVVTKDVAPFEIVGGVPAKHIGWRFNEEERDLITNSAWWGCDIDKLNQNIGFFRRECERGHF